MKKITLHIEGMHCKSCEILIQDSLLEEKGILYEGELLKKIEEIASRSD